MRPNAFVTTRALSLLTLASWVALVVSGIYLIYSYRPTATATYQDMETLRTGFSVEIWVHRIHRWLVVPAAGLPIALAATHVNRRQLRASAAAAAGFLAVAGLTYTGTRLPWDQLALWRVTVGANIRGYLAVFDDDNVRFVLIDGQEVTTSTLRSWFLLHTLALPAALLVIALGYFFVVRRQPLTEPISQPAVED